VHQHIGIADFDYPSILRDHRLSVADELQKVFDASYPSFEERTVSFHVVFLIVYIYNCGLMMHMRLPLTCPTLLHELK